MTERDGPLYTIKQILEVWRITFDDKDKNRGKLIGKVGKPSAVLGVKVNGSFVYRFGDNYAFEEELRPKRRSKKARPGSALDSGPCFYLLIDQHREVA